MISLWNLVIMAGVSAISYDTCRHQCMSDPRCSYANYGNNTCTINLSIGSSLESAAETCKKVHDAGFHKSGTYWVQSGSGAVQTTCDMDSGGWTLIGEIGGISSDIYDTWLRGNHNTAYLQSGTEITSGQYACLDAVEMAVNHATKMRFSSGGIGHLMGADWVEWELPAGRMVDTFWNIMNVNPADSSVSVETSVDVISSTGTVTNCKQNKYGINPFYNHGGSYPSSFFYTGGGTKDLDNCMGVGVMSVGSASANGWAENGGADCPVDNNDWPNVATNLPCSLAVWLL